MTTTPKVRYPITSSGANYTVPSGSVIQIDWSIDMDHKNSNCPGVDYQFSKTFVADADYDSFYDWYRANLIDITTGSENNFGTFVLNFNNISLNGTTSGTDTGIRGSDSTCATDVAPPQSCSTTDIYFEKYTGSGTDCPIFLTIQSQLDKCRGEGV